MSWKTALPFPSRRAAALSAFVAVASGPLYAQTTQPAPDASTAAAGPAVPAAMPAAAPAAPAASTRADEQELPVTMRAEELTGRPDRELNLYRDVEITRGATGITADTACYRRVEDEVTAEGNINMWRFGDRYKGDALQLNLETGKGWVTNPSYHLALNNAQGTARRIDFLGEDQAVVQDGTYSTCEGPDPDWYLKSSTLRLDQGRDIGTAGKTMIYFKDVPILGTPAMSFSLSGARRSGWLPPTIGSGSKGSGEVMVPYYFNIAPNRDLTVYPRLIFNRGLQLGATGRYIGETERGPYNGETHIEVLPNDRVAKTDRWWIDTLHSQTLAPGWTYGWNAHAASDDEYPSDFSRTVAASAERQLLRELRTDYWSQYWSLNARVQSYQVLQDPGAAANPALTVPRPYDRLPQINFHAGRYDVLGGFDWSMDAELVRFSHPDPTQVQGNRANLVGQVSYPIVRPGWFFTPKVIMHATRYDLDSNPNNPDAVRQINRTLPTVSLDSGLIFEREASFFGREATQTLEPRLFYVRTPYRDQSDIPNFDTGVAGFNYAQLFTENRFVGADKVSDANQLTAAIVSRFIESSGIERLRVAVGSRYYFTDPEVRLDASEQRNQKRSDALLAASGRISEAWSFDSGVQYDAQQRSLYSSNFGVQFAPAPMKVLNLEYRFQRDTSGLVNGFRNADVSAQWPLGRRWYGVSRASYSIRDRKLLEGLLGLEYKADCWIFRMGAQRFVTASQTVSTPIFFQIELNGLSRLGFGNPLETFNKSVTGYTRLNTNVGRP
ncbi:LPS-assembly protein LptD [Massilia sp. YIM B02763]|uniref:LPS-assembly protein LptD n=1 Tax=Massilia sp. YIM B02763 TaxID=3050130 RepID=UPI0025B67AB9|nr:LPS-assembly protein LptD [Massilia sp. YIM B02763]MDN4054129.1 LPS-assembly protein LptD [Massilia sp. YIM B02763]